jgi:hypothetical protein
MRRLRCSQQRTMDFVGSDINRCSGTVPVVDGFNNMPLNQHNPRHGPFRPETGFFRKIL